MVPEETLAADFVLFCGYFTLPALRGAPSIGLMNRVRTAGGRIFFDSDWDPQGWNQESRAEVARLLPLVDVFLPSDEEARGLTGIEDPAAAGRELQRISGGRVVVKLGQEGCMVLGPGGEHRVPAPSVRVRGTTGTGDSFNGGLMYAISEGRSGRKPCGSRPVWLPRWSPEPRGIATRRWKRLCRWPSRLGLIARLTPMLDPGLRPD
jgi:sugar/nucleoside kinase (ribokinase family)